MAILSAQIGQIGLVGVSPTWIYVDTKSTLAQVLTPGFLDPLLTQGYIINEKQAALIYTTDYGAVVCQVDVTNGVITLSQQSGGGGGVASVTGTAGRISSTGGANPIIDMVATAVTPGAYTAADITVDAYGRITAAANGSGGSGVDSVTSADADRITIGGTASDPTVNISATYAGQNTIDTVGIIGAGTWEGDVIDPEFGGTGVDNSGKTITLAGSLSTTGGAYSSTFTLQGNTNVTFPTTGTLATTAGTVASITSADVNKITIAGTSTAPTVNIAATYVGQDTITTVGAIGAGTWEGDIVAPEFGGTGVDNGVKTLTLAGNTSFVGGAYAFTGTLQGNTAVTFPTSGTLATTGSTVASVTGTANQIDSTGGTTPVLTLSNTVIFPGTVTLNANPITPLEAATKQYVDAVVAGLTYKNACVAASVGAYTATYNNGAAGVGATLTNADTQAVFEIDGINPSVSDRVLIRSQAAPAENGIYVVTDVGSGATNWVLTRSTDYDTVAEISAGDFLVVTGGLTLDTTSWLQQDTVATIGTDPISFVQFTTSSSGVTSVSAGTGITVVNGTTTPTVSINTGYVGQASITTLGTIGDGTWEGDIVAPEFGGTGVDNGIKTLTLSGDTLFTGGAFTFTGTLTGNTSVTFPTSGTLATTAGTVASVTSGDAAKITIGGTATNPTVNIAAGYIGQNTITTLGTITNGTWNGTTIGVANGGTGNTTFTAYSLVCAGTTATGAFQNVSGVGTTGQLLSSNGASALPSWASASTLNLAVTNATNDFAFNQQYRMHIQDYSEAVSALGSVSGSTAMNLQSGNVFTATVTGVTTFSITNVPTSGTCASVSLVLTNGGSSTVNWMSGTIWPAGTPPTLTAAGIDVLVFFTVNGGTTWYGGVAGQAYA